MVTGISQEIDALDRQEWIDLVSSSFDTPADHPSYPSIVANEVTRDALKHEKEEDILNVFKEVGKDLKFEGKMKLLSSAQTLADGYDDPKQLMARMHPKVSFLLKK